MANWGKLNKEFDTLLDNLTDEDWNNWFAKREANKSMRKFEMQLKAKIQAEKISLSNCSGIEILNSDESSSNWVTLEQLAIHFDKIYAGENTVALAA